MGIVLLVLLVGLPLAMLGMAVLWDHRQRRITGAVPTVTRSRGGLRKAMLARSLDNAALEARNRRRQGSNFGDLGPR